MNKFSFPKGSLKFKKLEKTKTTVSNNVLLDYITRARYNKALHNEFGNLQERNFPPEIRTNVSLTTTEIKNARKNLKSIPSFISATDYEITFKHPKWFRMIGEIKVKAIKTNMKDALKEVHKQFKEKKEAYRKFRTWQRVQRINSLQSDIIYDKSGGIPYMPNLKTSVYLKFLKDQEKKIVFSDKVPKKDKTNYVAVELEFFCDWHKDKLGIELYDAGVGKHVTLKTDGSIRCHHQRRHHECQECHDKVFPHELCVIAEEGEFKEVIGKICKLLSKANAQVNKSCGTHVHLDMRNRNVENAYQNLISSQNILYRMNPKSRVEEHARKIQERDFELAKRTDRHVGINPTAYAKHKTIEVRIHAGTTDFNKITNWVDILLSIVSTEKRIVKTFVSLKSFCETFGVNDNLKEYMKERIEKFKIKDEMLPAPEAERGVA